MKIIYVMMMLLMVGCTGGSNVTPTCPKVKVVKVSIPVNKRGGLDRSNRLVAFSLLEYYTYENTRTNKLVDEINKINM